MSREQQEQERSTPPRQGHQRGIPAEEWIRRIDQAGEESLIPGDRNRTAQLLRKLRDNPILIQGRPRGRPPKRAPKNP